jgi:membrane glycosyltransferase
MIWWFAPGLAGFVLAIQLSVWTSRVKPGEWTRRHGLFLIPEETQPPRVLIRLEQELAMGVDRPFSRPCNGLEWVRTDHNVRTLHLALLPPSQFHKTDLDKHALEGFLLKLRTKGPSSLTRNEQLQILQDPDSVKALADHAK